MSSTTTSNQHAEVPHNNNNNNNNITNDSSFESFIDSDLILDASSPAPTLSSPSKTTKESTKPKVAPLSALPSRLTDGSGDDFINYSNASSSSVTTPTSSNSSNLHSLNFDFFDSHGNGQAVNVDNAFHSEGEGSHLHGDVPSMATFGDGPNQQSLTSNHIFSWNAPNSFFPVPMTHTLSRSVDDLDHEMGHNGVHHHQRSLSLRDVAPPTAADGISLESLTTLPFPSVKMEEEQDASFISTFEGSAPSPITEDRSSPSSSAVSSSLFDQGSPRQDKKRRLASPSESLQSNYSIKSAKSASMTKSNNTSSCNGKKNNGGNRRSRANTMNGKGDTPVTSVAFDASSLIENAPVQALKTMDRPSSMVAPPQQQNQQAQPQQIQQVGTSPQQSLPTPILDGNTVQEGTTRDQVDQLSHADSAAPKSGNKRPPPSASQVTESGQPFPVIDTSAKHSSLFVPPDTSGLTKREARLVKNRAAAFLSRQRKREQFEELEIKCKNLCRLVWRFWEIVAGPNHDIPFAEKFSQARILPILLQEEVMEVKEVLEMVVALKGGSVAPTEDGQLQGAVAAGINSANGKIVPDANTAQATRTQAASTQSSSYCGATSTIDNGEIARLRAELEESKKRESALQTELAQERSMRMNDSYHHSATKPFKGGKQDEALSLTISPKYQEEDEDEDMSRGRVVGDDATKGRSRGRSSGRSGPSRTSERLQRQQSHLALTSGSTVANGGQRKAAGAALMMVLFSFALFGLPSGQMSRVGGITRAGSTEDFSVGKVLGAPLSGAQYNQDEDEDMLDYDLTCKQAPSSHLSAKDLLPPMPDISDLLNLDDRDEDDELTSRQSSISQSFRDVLGSGQGDDEETSVDYKAFAKDLGASLDWDVQRGFLVIGSDPDNEDDDDLKNKNKEDANTEANGKSKTKEDEAPTKLTLFVPAPDMGETLEAEDRFYDAPLADAATVTTSSTIQSSNDSKTASVASNASGARDLTQAEATRAALRVLRNHRVAQEAAALATSRRLGKKPLPSQRVSSTSSGIQTSFSNSKGRKNNVPSTEEDVSRSSSSSNKMDGDLEEEQDYSKEVMDTTTTADKIRGTDFYQLEFSLSGAKVRNVAELAKLLGVVRNKKD